MAKHFNPMETKAAQDEITLREAVNKLDSMIDQKEPALAKDMVFAMSLVKQYKDKGTLSPKQAYWVHTLREKGEQSVSGSTGVGLSTKYESLAGFDPILEWFDNAGKRVQWPSCRLEHCRLKGRAGMAKVRVIDKATDEFLGQIESPGTLTWKAHRAMPQAVIDELRSLCLNPLEHLGRLGRATGNCCICGRPLTNDESVERGIGPICVETWGI